MNQFFYVSIQLLVHKARHHSSPVVWCALRTDQLNYRDYRYFFKRLLKMVQRHVVFNRHVMMHVNYRSRLYLTAQN
jgi:hypothetical protein